MTSAGGVIKFKVGCVGLAFRMLRSAGMQACFIVLKCLSVLLLHLWNHTELAVVYFLFINILWKTAVKLFFLCLVYSLLLQLLCESFEIQQIQLLVLKEYSMAEQMILTLQLT